MANIYFETLMKSKKTIKELAHIIAGWSEQQEKAFKEWAENPVINVSAVISEEAWKNISLKPVQYDPKIQKKFQELFDAIQDKKQITEDMIIILDDNSWEIQESVQEKLFELGYNWWGWGDFENLMRYFNDLKCYVLYFYHKEISYCKNTDDDYLKNYHKTKKKITAEELLKDY